MVPPSGPHPIIQIHPTRRCNLRCLHCYSTSGPAERDLLGVETLTSVIEDARGQGYEVASFSGGEPILYKPLSELLRHAKSLGMRTTVTSNGMLLGAERLDELTGCVDVLAISLDGLPESHNKMRACNQAFERMQANLEAVRKSRIDFGFIFTLTQHNVNEMEWAARFAVEQGAKLFHIHPLEEVGRAGETLCGSRPDEIESAFGFLEAERLRTLYANRIIVQLDLFHRDVLTRHPERFLPAEDECRPERLADCVSPLILEADGTLVPLGYSFGRQYSIGSVLHSRLRTLAPLWLAEDYPRFQQFCGNVYREACKPSELPFLNWYELIGMRSTATNFAPIQVF